MVARQYAGVNPKTGLLAGFAQRLPEWLLVPGILDNLLAVTAPGHHVIRRARIQDANRRGHSPGRLPTRTPAGQAQYPIFYGSLQNAAWARIFRAKVGQENELPTPLNVRLFQCCQ